VPVSVPVRRKASAAWLNRPCPNLSNTNNTEKTITSGFNVSLARLVVEKLQTGQVAATCARFWGFVETCSQAELGAGLCSLAVPTCSRQVFLPSYVGFSFENSALVRCSGCRSLLAAPFNLRNMPGAVGTHGSRFTAGRVKRLLQTNDEVGHMAASVPVLVGHATEHFLRDLSLQALAYAKESGATTITSSLLRYTVEKEPRFQFLRPLFAKVPPLTEKELQEMSRNRDSRSRVNHSERRPRAKRKTTAGTGTGKRGGAAPRRTKPAGATTADASHETEEDTPETGSALATEAPAPEVALQVAAEEESRMPLASSSSGAGAATADASAKAGAWHILEEDYDVEE
jgi:hypothetical protein